MSEKKIITVVTKPQEVEIEGNIITNEELKDLWLHMRGGNASRDNVELMRHLATNVVKDDELKRAPYVRAAFLEEAEDKLKAMIYPKDEAEKVLITDPSKGDRI